MPKQIVYVTAEGNELNYDEPTPEVAAFVERVRALLENEHASVDDMVALVYGVENPIMDRELMPGRGAATRAVLANPIYHVLSDMIWLKEAAEDSAPPSL